MSKLGGTPFYARNITAEVDDGLYVSAAMLNRLRRIICDRMLIDNPGYEIREYNLPRKTKPRTDNTVQFRAEVSTGEQLEQALRLDFELIYAPMCLLDESTPQKKRIAVIPPLVLTDCEEECAERLSELREMGFNKGLAHTLAHAELLKKCEYNILGGYRMNVLNSLSAKTCTELGFRDVTLSIEGKAAELAEIVSPRPLGIVAYGRLPLMLTRRCPIANGKTCGRKSALYGGAGCSGSLKDRQGNDIPVLCGGNCVELLNPDVLVLSDKSDTLRKFDFAILKFTLEKDLGKVVKMYQDQKKPNGKLTRGLYFRGAE